MSKSAEATTITYSASYASLSAEAPAIDHAPSVPKTEAMNEFQDEYEDEELRLMRFKFLSELAN